MRTLLIAALSATFATAALAADPAPATTDPRSTLPPGAAAGKDPGGPATSPGAVAGKDPGRQAASPGLAGGKAPGAKGTPPGLAAGKTPAPSSPKPEPKPCEPVKPCSID